MAGSVSYLHCAVSVNISSIDFMIRNASKGLKDYSGDLMKLYEDLEKRTGKLHKYKMRDRDYFTGITDFFQSSLHQLGNKTDNLKKTLPRPPSDAVLRDKRSVPTALLRLGGKALTQMVQSPNFFMSLAQGIFGTFMGLYNAHQLGKLRNEIATVKQVQERLITVAVNHEKRLSKAEEEIWAIRTSIAIETAVNAPLAVARLTRILTNLGDLLQTIIHAAQQAQHHRLALDLLSPSELEALFQDVAHKAELYKYQLLIQQPTDLFQIEVSYLFDGQTLMLILHVPMVPTNSLLRLFRLHPFPIPFSSDKALWPKPPSSVLAISPSSPRLITSIELADLMGCHQVNNVFLCERHGVLQRNAKSTCLGALFEQDISAAQRLCELQLVPYQEHALQLESNWFLIYSLRRFISYVRCQNGTVFEIAVRAGVNRIFLDPSCSAELLDHVLFSDFSLQLDTTIKYFEWEAADIAAFGITEEDIRATIRDLDDHAVEQELLLSEIMAHRKMRARIPWTFIWGILGLLGLLGTAISLQCCSSCHLLRRVRQITGLHLRTDPDHPLLPEPAELQVLQR